MARDCPAGGSVAVANGPAPVDAVLPAVAAASAATKREVQEAFESALTKFDSLDALFGQGMQVADIGQLLAQEMQKDLPQVPLDELQRLASGKCGRAFASWKTGGGAVTRSVPLEENPLSWASIDHYPDFVAGSVRSFFTMIDIWAAALVQRAWRSQRRAKDKHVAAAVMSWLRPRIEKEFLQEPLYAASLKYDGTCLGRLDDGKLLGRARVTSPGTYQRTSTAEAESCDAAAFRAALIKETGIEFGRVAVYGELLCNPTFYGYADKGLQARWLCFGAVAELPDGADNDAISVRLGQLQLAHGIKRPPRSQGNGGEGEAKPIPVDDDSRKVRLLLCPALRRLLQETTGSEVVEEPPLPSRTQAGLVEGLADALIAGEQEGVVVIVPRSGGQASIRKWKNAAEGEGVSRRHAQALKSVQNRLSVMARLGVVDKRVAEMVDTLVRVAEADTSLPWRTKQREAKGAKKAAGSPADLAGSPVETTASSPSAAPESPSSDGIRKGRRQK